LFFVFEHCLGLDTDLGISVSDNPQKIRPVASAWSSLAYRRLGAMERSRRDTRGGAGSADPPVATYIEQATRRRPLQHDSAAPKVVSLTNRMMSAVGAGGCGSARGDS